MANQFSSSSSSSSDLDAVSVPEWEIGLPCSDDLTPLSQPLLTPFLAAAFSVSPEHVRTPVDVHLASLQTIASIRHPRAKILEDSRNEGDVLGDSSSSKRRTMVRRQRLVWTPQLHGRFVEVVARLGPKDAVPKKIMEMMNVEGLTREHVASHLQKYQLKLKESSSS